MSDYYRTPVEAGHRAAVGGMWDEVGQLQFDFLVERGLEPRHTLLDVGCGSLRAGRLLVPYLDPGNYVGIDQEASLLVAGRDLELGAALAAERQPLLVEMRDFGVGRLGRTFDVAMAQSLFTHISLNLVMRCVYSVAGVLNPGGVFYATFFENEHGPAFLDPIPRCNGEFHSHYHQDPFHYDLATLRAVLEPSGLDFEYIGEWNHPRGQRIFALHRPA